MKWTAIVLFLYGVIVLPALGDESATQKDKDLRGKAETLVKPLLEKKQAVGVVVGVREGDQTHVFGFGHEALEGNKIPDGKTVFEVGSVTKVFTSLALAQLAHEGLVKVDEPVERLLPDKVKVAARSGREVTLEDLSTHTSGLPRIPLKLVFQAFGSTDPYADYKEKDLYDFLKIWKPTQDIGAKWAYSNLGAGLLGHALARRAGVTYDELIADRITKPLGLKDTAIKLSQDQERRLAKPYAVGNTPESRWTFDVLAGCGALHSTADDLLVFLAAEMGIKDSTLRPAMELTQKPRRETGVKGLRMGLGWLVNKLPKDEGELELVWHNGGTGGFSSFVGFIKERRLGVVVLANAGPSPGSMGVVDAVGVGLLKRLNTGEKTAK